MHVAWDIFCLCICVGPYWKRTPLNVVTHCSKSCETCVNYKCTWLTRWKRVAHTWQWSTTLLVLTMAGHLFITVPRYCLKLAKLLSRDAWNIIQAQLKTSVVFLPFCLGANHLWITLNDNLSDWIGQILWIILRTAKLQNEISLPAIWLFLK